MRWLGASAAVVLSTLAASSRELPPRVVALAGLGASELTPGQPGETLGPSSCPPGSAPDDGACVRLGGPEATSATVRANAHRERSGRWATYEQIPRLPERPAEYEAYVHPIPPGLPGGKYVISGYDLDRPDELQRRGRHLRHVGHGGLDLPQARGTPVKLVALEHQDGDAEVLYAGPLFGTTVVTRHTRREAGGLREYLVLFGHLDAIAPGVAPGLPRRDGDPIGTVGDTGSPELVHLHFEVRRVRDEIDLSKIPAGAMLVSESVSVVCDPRNVLPLR